MAWQQWVLIGLYIMELLAIIYMIDEPREPLGRGTAVAKVIILLLLTWLVVSI